MATVTIQLTDLEDWAWLAHELYARSGRLYYEAQIADEEKMAGGDLIAARASELSRAAHLCEEASCLKP